MPGQSSYHPTAYESEDAGLLGLGADAPAAQTGIIADIGSILGAATPAIQAYFQSQAAQPSTGAPRGVGATLAPGSLPTGYVPPASSTIFGIPTKTLIIGGLAIGGLVLALYLFKGKKRRK